MDPMGTMVNRNLCSLWLRALRKRICQRARVKGALLHLPCDRHTPRTDRGSVLKRTTPIPSLRYLSLSQKIHSKT